MHSRDKLRMTNLNTSHLVRRKTKKKQKYLNEFIRT